jgi:hypothetical protein
MAYRLERLNSLLRRELSDLLRLEVKNPRLSSVLISITGVEIAPDLKYVWVGWKRRELCYHLFVALLDFYAGNLPRIYACA